MRDKGQGVCVFACCVCFGDLSFGGRGVESETAMHVHVPPAWPLVKCHDPLDDTLQLGRWSRVQDAAARLPVESTKGKPCAVGQNGLAATSQQHLSRVFVSTIC